MGGTQSGEKAHQNIFNGFSSNFFISGRASITPTSVSDPRVGPSCRSTIFVILLNTTNSTTSDEIITSHYAPTVRSYFKVIHDRTYTLDSSKGAWLNLTLKKRLRSVASYHSNTAQGATANSLGKMALYMLIIASYDSDDGSAVNLENYIDVQSRYYFTDA